MLVRHVLSQLSYAPFVSLLRCSPQRRGSLYTFVPVLSTPFFRKNPSFFRRTFCVPKLSVRLTCFPENVILDAYGELSEWFKEPVLKTGDGETHREFESHTLRQKETAMLVRELPFLFVLFSSDRLRIREKSEKRIDTDSGLTSPEFSGVLFLAWGCLSPLTITEKKATP